MDKFALRPGTEAQPATFIDVNGWYCGIGGVWLHVADESGRSAIAFADLPSPLDNCESALGAVANPPGWLAPGALVDPSNIIRPGTLVHLTTSLCGEAAESITWEVDSLVPVESLGFADNFDGTAVFTAPSDGLVSVVVTVDFGSSCLQRWFLNIGIGDGP